MSFKVLQSFFCSLFLTLRLGISLVYQGFLRLWWISVVYQLFLHSVPQIHNTKSHICPNRCGLYSPWRAICTEHLSGFSTDYRDTVHHHPWEVISVILYFGDLNFQSRIQILQSVFPPLDADKSHSSELWEQRSVNLDETLFTLNIIF